VQCWKGSYGVAGPTRAESRKALLSFKHWIAVQRGNQARKTRV